VRWRTVANVDSIAFVVRRCCQGIVTLLACRRKCSNNFVYETNRSATQRTPTDAISHAGYWFPPDVISYAVWLYYRLPLSLRMIEELLAARGIELIYETVRRWSVKFGLDIARRIRSIALGDKWHLDEVAVAINGRKHWLWRAVDQHGAVLDVLVQSPRDRHAARRLMRRLLRKHGRAPRVLITDKLRSYAAATGISG
jgi:putative transposase